VIPLYGFLEGDTIGLLVLAGENERLSVVADKLRASARLRAEIDGPIQLVFRGRPVQLDLTVAQAGISALDRIDVRRAEAP
jgi:hypothetical protein